MDRVYKKVESKKAHEIAHKHRLTIFQEWASAFDGITSIQLSLYPKQIKDKLLQLIDNPVLYFAVQEDDRCYYINYLIYHSFDWADYKIPLIKDWLNKQDSHQHDTESVLLQIDKESGSILDALIDLMLKKMSYLPHEKDMIILHIDAATAAPKSSNTIETVVDVGRP